MSLPRDLVHAALASLDADDGLDPASYLPATLPPRWRVLARTPDGAAYRRDDELQVIVSACREDDGERWLHVSLARADRLPSYGELTEVKRAFVGPDRYAYQVHVPEAKHVNLHPHCLHLWACLDAPAGQVLPEFSGTVAGVRSV